ncbi:MAG TPA: methyltransferase domain-containing protein [Candidatus Woesebacteria bacterium]|nr:methyltransferase domain-containing protein [Candidatus Woesebacteria bacterium]
MKFILFVGANNTLAAEEISVQIKEATLVSPNTYLFETDSADSAKKIAIKLGCSIKLAYLLEEVTVDAKSLSSQIKEKTFSINNLGKIEDNARLHHEIKNILGGGRFQFAKDEFGLSPVIIKKHKVDEFFIDSDNNQVWKTIWVHNFEHWIKKDRRMPRVDPRAGMLPPKIARSMVNLVPLDPHGKTLLDPFCGSGRVLVEAAEVGYHIAGVDIIAKQVADTRENLQSMNFDGHLEVLDATHLSTKFKDIDAIVTEPFLGKSKFRQDEIRYIVPGLEKLYLGCLKDWLKVLKPGGFIVMVFPWFDDGHKVYKTSEIIDGKLKLSYNPLKRGIFYSRPEADVKREILVLQKK